MKRNSPNIIIVENEKKYEYENLQEIINSFLGAEYFNLSLEEKRKILKLKIYANQLSNINYPILNEYVYILLLIKENKIVIFEKEESNIFLKHMDKSKVSEYINNEYITINDYIDEILKNYFN